MESDKPKGSMEAQQQVVLWELSKTWQRRPNGLAFLALTGELRRDNFLEANMILLAPLSKLVYTPHCYHVFDVATDVPYRCSFLVGVAICGLFVEI